MAACEPAGPAEEGPGARAFREAAQSGKCTNDIKEAVDKALCGRTFPSQTFIPLRDRRTALEHDLAQAHTLAQKLRVFKTRLKYFQKIGAVVISPEEDKMWLLDLAKPPFWTVYILADDDAPLYLFTIGVHFFYPDLPDICLMFPSITGCNSRHDGSCFRAGSLANKIVQEMIAGRLVFAEGKSLLECAAGNERNDDVIYDELEWLKQLRFEFDLSEKRPSGVQESLEVVESRFPDFEAYQQFGVQTAALRNFNEAFLMTPAEVHGYLGSLSWFTTNWLDRDDTRCFGIKLPAFVL